MPFISRVLFRIENNSDENFHVLESQVKSIGDFSFDIRIMRDGIL